MCEANVLRNDEDTVLLVSIPARSLNASATVDWKKSPRFFLAPLRERDDKRMTCSGSFRGRSPGSTAISCETIRPGTWLDRRQGVSMRNPGPAFERSPSQTLNGPLSWRQDGELLLPEVKQLA